jgi:hypothetical protein
MPSNLRKSLRRLRKWGALALGFGGLFAVSATADTPQLQPLEAGTGSHRLLALDQQAVMMRLKGEAIYIAEREGVFEELSLRDAGQAAYLRELLRDAGAAERAVAVPGGSVIVANGGASQDGNKPKTSDAGTTAGKKPPSKKSKQPPKGKSGEGK